MTDIGFIGMGNMAQALVSGFKAAGQMGEGRIYAYAPNQKKLENNCRRLGMESCSSLKEVSQKSDMIFMACKPYQIEDVLKELGDEICGKAVVSVAAGWNYQRYRSALPADARIQFIMPNTPAAVGEGVFLAEEENDLMEEERNFLFELLTAVGMVKELPSRLMDAAMAISGCGPAFMDMIIEALGDAGVKNGLQRKDAYELACFTMIGSARLKMETGLHPGELKDNVCSPAGTTIKGVASLEESGIRYAFIKAIDEVLK